MTKRIVFMGTPDFSVPVLEQLIESSYDVVAVVTQPDRPKGRKKKLTPSPVKAFAQSHEIPVLQPEKIKHDYQTILDYHPDLIVTAAYGQILPEPLLESPPFGCINVHASLLPKLRGGAPIHYAILNGEKETGITIMYMVKALDAGAMLSQEKVAIHDDDTVADLHDRLAEVGSQLLMRTIPQLFEGSIEPTEQNHEEATYAPNITRDVERIDFSDTQQNIYNQVRGLNPWPVAFTTYHDQSIKVWAAEKVQDKTNQKPGSIVSVDVDEGVDIATGDGGILRLTEIQPAGKKRMKTVDFLRGSADFFTVGDQLG
ncbi:methionyl-tRNA formyltransferase [Alkalibacillus almallahensis]|uniref:methionyl-tRNA formyltransferase n=1 Tax=Alkalibacillus almallahensis TaxID=1379154 RepID=UPI00142282AC|nr:methionyl-tRNA formyltransferase [Alkalibacillus almallahensis]NIK10737.1 methionyl-tRNA formyltransferase [Alkalibacillus almallahensis]